MRSRPRPAQLSINPQALANYDGTPSSLVLELELKDSLGQVVASATDAPLNYTVATTGRHVLRVTTSSGSGVYSLATSLTPAPDVEPLKVNYATTARGNTLTDALNYAPHFAYLHLTAPVRADTLTPDQILIDGVPVPSATVLEDNRIVVSLPNLLEGEHELELLPTTLQGLAGEGVTEDSFTFTVDTIAPQVVSASVENGADCAWGSYGHVGIR